MTPLQDLLQRKYPFVVQPDPDGDGGWEIIYPDLPGCSTWIASLDEVTDEAQTILRLWIQDSYEHGHDLPEPSPSQPVLWNWSEPRDKGVADVARELEVTERRVQALASSRHVGRKVGRDWRFSDRDIDAMRERKAGRPRKSTPLAS